MISVDLPKTVISGSMIQADPGSRSTGSDPGIHFRDPRACLLTCFTGQSWTDMLPGSPGRLLRSHEATFSVGRIGSPRECSLDHKTSIDRTRCFI